MERWKSIDGYEGLYEVSSYGRVRSLDRFDRLGRITSGRVLSPTNNGCGYYTVQLSNGGIKKRHYIHRLVAKAFIKNYSKLNEINHKDENKSNNNVSNLEWCSRKYNVNYGDHNAKMSHTKGTLFRVINNVTHEASMFYSKDAAASILHIGRDKVAKGLKDGSISYSFRGNNLSFSFETV